VRASATILCVAQRDELEKPSQDEFAHEVSFDVDVTKEFPAHRILAHSNASKIVFVEKSGYS